MSDIPEKNEIGTQGDPLMDTQYLLGMGPPAEGDFELEDILAEFGSADDTPPAPVPEPEPAPQPQEAVSEPAAEKAPPEPVKAPPEEAVEAVVKETVKEAMEEAAPPPAETIPAEETPPEPPPEEQSSPPNAQANGEDPGLPPVSIEAIENLMANTVDAVKEEQEQKQERLRKRLEKARKAVSRSFSKKEATLRHPMPDAENEPQPTERAMWHKRRARESRKALQFATLVAILLWMPWALAQFGIQVPFFSDSSDNAALCVLIPQALVSIISWPVFRAALEMLREGSWSMYASAGLCTLVTLLDEMTLLLLPKRVDAAPLGGLAAILLVFMLWGLSGMHRGFSESLRTTAMGEPTRVVDRCGSAVSKGRGSRKGFFTRLAMEDSPSQWQRLLLPVLAAASLIFALVSSFGRGQPQNFLWCWSVILCSATSLVFPLAYCVPFGRLAVRLAHCGAALAGQYGASILASTRRLAVADEDLFPANTASLGGVKLYGEERNKAISYAATLAVQAGGNLGRIFGSVCQLERINYQGLEHFHIHDDGGLSGIIRGETVLVGTPAFMRHKAVRLPGSIPAKTCVCMAVDGQLSAVFVMKYIPNDTVEYALRSIRRNGLQITLAVRDSNMTPRLLKERFGISGNIQYPDLSERLTLSDLERDAEEPNGLMYREGLLPLASLAVGSSRLCQTALVGNLLSIFSSIAGVLLGFYLTFTGSFAVLTPPLLLTYLLLWVAPMLPLVWTVDKL